MRGLSGLWFGGTRPGLVTVLDQDGVQVIFRSGPGLDPWKNSRPGFDGLWEVFVVSKTFSLTFRSGSVSSNILQSLSWFPSLSEQKDCLDCGWDLGLWIWFLVLHYQQSVVVLIDNSPCLSLVSVWVGPGLSTSFKVHLVLSWDFGFPCGPCLRTRPGFETVWAFATWSGLGSDLGFWI